MSALLIRTSKIAQWGNSAAIRLGAASLERAQLHLDDAIEIIARDDEIIIRRQRPKVTMAALLETFDPDLHRHALTFDVDPAGTETA